MQNKNNQKFQHAAIIGIGLIGSSIALALRKYYKINRITAADINYKHRKQAQKMKLADEVFESPELAVQDADIVILATPVSSFKDITKKIQAKLIPDCVLTDTGSVKQKVINDLQFLIPGDIHFIPVHPVAGTELSGPTAGFSQLFQNRHVIFTPIQGSDPKYILKLKKMWQACGAEIEIMTPEHHDRVLAITSHLPHLIAYSIVETAASLEKQLKLEKAKQEELIKNPEVIRYSAGGFRDFTRIAASDPTMWRDVFIGNREAVLEMLGRFQEDLFALQKAIRDSDAQKMQKWFTRTQTIRKRIIKERQAGNYIATEKNDT